MRLVKNQVPSMEQLGLPDILKTIAKSPRGIILMAGTTGSGKSTTSAAIIDLFNSDSVRRSGGSIVLDGEHLEKLSPRRMAKVRGRRIAMVFQEFSLVPTLSVAHNILLLREPRTRLGLTDEAPVYQRPYAEPAGRAAALRLTPADLKPLPAPSDAFMAVLGAPGVASKRWIYRQYDHMVRGNSIALDGLTAGVVRVKGTERALAMSTDGNGRYCELDPRQGAKLAVAEAALDEALAAATGAARKVRLEQMLPRFVRRWTSSPDPAESRA